MNLFGRARERAVAVIDIGSGSAGVAIALANEDGPIAVAAAHRTILTFEERTEDQMVAGVSNALAESGKAALDAYAISRGHAAPPVSRVYIIIRAPWTRSKTAAASEEYADDARITEQMIAALAQKAIADEKDFAGENMLESSVIRVELNGYPTGKPVGKRAHQLAVTLYLSDCDPRVRRAAAETAAKLFPGREQTVRSGSRAFLGVMRERSHEKAGYVLVDMVSEATAFLVVRDGAIAENGLVKEGVRTLLRRITGEGALHEETLSLVRMVIADACHGAACDQLNAALGKVEPELARIFGETFAKLAAIRRLPTTLALSVHPDLAPWLAAFFARIDFTQFTATTQPFQVDVLSTDRLAEWVAPEKGVDLDTGLSIACAFVNIETRR